MTPLSWQFAYRGQRVLVLGASGFIGSRVSAVLAELGAEVIRGGRAPRMDRPGPTRVEVDLTLPGTAAALLATWQPTVTFNLAGYGIDPRERDPGQAHRINAALPAEMAVACGALPQVRWSGLRLVHVGSALEYGTATGALAETTVPHPTTIYGQTKLAGTEAVAAACSSGQLAGATARLFTVYGPGEPPGRLLPTLRLAAQESGPVPLTMGEQRRDFTYVDDVVEGLLRLGSEASGGIGTVNLATGVLTPVREFIERAARVIGVDLERLQFGMLPTRPEEMRHDPVCLARLESLTGWKPETAIEAGVQKTLATSAPGRR